MFYNATVNSINTAVVCICRRGDMAWRAELKPVELDVKKFIR